MYQLSQLSVDCIYASQLSVYCIYASLQDHSINMGSLNSLYGDLVNHSTVYGDTNAHVIDSQYYYYFVDEYVSITGSLSQEQKDSLQYFVDHQ